MNSKHACLLLTLFSVVSVKSWSFRSTFEAHTINMPNPGICMGNCIRNKCTYNWKAHKTPCRGTSIPTLKYRTLDNELCTSNCGNFDGTSYQWCAVGKKHWGKCSRLIALNATESYRTENEYESCSDECATRGKAYYWCHTVLRTWRHCYPEKKILVFNYRTKFNNICITPCEIKNKGYKNPNLIDNKNDLPYCYDNKGIWSRCFLNPEYDNTIDEHLRRFCKPGGFFEEGYRLCRLDNECAFIQLNSTCTLDVEAVASRHEKTNPTVTVRQWSSRHLITNDINPIYSYTVYPVPRAFGQNQLNLPLVVRAVITASTLLPVDARRPDLTSEVTTYYGEMNIIIGTNNDDEGGYIVASKLGGPMETYNIFPQSWRHNRGSCSTWSRIEESLDSFIRGHNDRHAEYTAVLSYSVDLNNELVTRPIAIAVRIRLYVGGVLSDIYGNPLASITDNPYENMYFSNDPDVSCD